MRVTGGDGARSRDWRQRLAALRSSETAETFDRDTLLRLLDDPAADVRRKACNLLGRIADHDLAPALIAKAPDPDKNVRNQVAGIVRPWAEESDAVTRLLMDAFDAEEMRLRFLAARCWPYTEPLEPVLALLDDPEASVRWVATSRVGWRIATRTEDRDPAAIEALRKATRDPVPTVREEAFRGFWAVGLEADLAVDLDAGLDRIVEALDDPSERVRLAAAIALGDRGDPRVLAPLQVALADRSSWVRIHAVDGIASVDRELGFAAAVSALRDRNRTARVHAARTLGRLRDRRAIEPLTDFYARSTAVESRLAAVGALGQIGVKAAVPTLIEALADSTPDERRRAVCAIPSASRCREGAPQDPDARGDGRIAEQLLLTPTRWLLSSLSRSLSGV